MNQERREVLACFYVEDLGRDRPNLESRTFSDEEFKFYSPKLSRFYIEHGVVPPVPDLKRRVLMYGFHLPTFLDRAQSITEEVDFCAYMVYWGLRLNIRIIKEAETLALTQTYGADEQLIEDLVESEMVEQLNLPRWWEPYLEEWENNGT